MGTSTSPSLSPVMKTSILLLLLSFLLISVTVSQPHNRHKHSRDLGGLAAENPGTSLHILRQIRRNIRKSQASLKLVISMERELQRVARSVASHITDTVEQSPAEPLPQQQRSQKDNSQLPFSAWAG